MIKGKYDVVKVLFYAKPTNDVNNFITFKR